MLLYPLFIFDLKDCFLTTGLSTMFMTYIHNKSWSEIKEEIRLDPWGLKYYKYEVATWRSLIARFTKQKQNEE
jgi:hypothetical protein